MFEIASSEIDTSSSNDPVSETLLSIRGIIALPEFSDHPIM